MEKIFTDANFETEVLKSTVPVFVDFWAPWCGPCRLMGPIVEELAIALAGKNITIGKLNVDENPNTAGQFSVMSIPSFLLFKNGQVVDTVVGGVPKEKLQAMMLKYI